MRVLGQIHAQILTRSDLPLAPRSFALAKVLCFAACRNVHYATRLLNQIPLPNVFCYNTVMRGFLLRSPSREPILLFKKLLQKKFPKSNTFTLAFVLKSCSTLAAFEEGEQVHKYAIMSGLGEHLFVRTSLMNFYVKCDENRLAQKVFDEMPERNVVAWSAMIGGYARVGMVNEALAMFREMQANGIEPDEVSMVVVISACAVAGALGLGKWMHAFVDRKGIKNDLEMSTALVNMYAKCGCINKAKEVFEAMPFKDAKAWSSMIVGFAIHGLAEEALSAFARMEKAQVVRFVVLTFATCIALEVSGTTASLLNEIGFTELPQILSS